MSNVTIIVAIAALALAVLVVVVRRANRHGGTPGLGGDRTALTEILDHVREIRFITGDSNAIWKGLTNVTTRGHLGEVELGLILEDLLTSDQFSRNVATVAGSSERVEFAIRMPGTERGQTVWLPVDSKFPLEDYKRLCDAAQAGDEDAVKRARNDLRRAITTGAKEIRKYVSPPATTEIAVLFLPSEGLYAEALRDAKLQEELGALRVVLAGPTTLTALVQAWRMGFQTLAIDLRASELWDVISSIQREFEGLDEEMATLRKHLGNATKKIESTMKRTTQMRDSLTDAINRSPDAASGTGGTEGAEKTA